MAFMREIGLESISNARKGKMPAVDAITRQKVGSVPVDHPKVLSGEWIHHSKGVPGTKHPSGYGVGSTNYNYREMTANHRVRIMGIVSRSVVDDRYFIQARFNELLEIEFSEFKRVSYRWILNNYGTWENLIDEYNLINNTHIKKPSRYYKSSDQIKKIALTRGQNCWVTDGKSNIRLKLTELDEFLTNNKTFKRGQTK